MTLSLICNRCGASFDVEKAELLAGPAVYRTCPACRVAEKKPTLAASDAVTGCCTQCGRVLKATTRTMCLACLGGSTL